MAHHELMSHIHRSWAANGMTVQDKHYAILCFTTRGGCCVAWTNPLDYYTGWPGTSIPSSNATTTHRNSSSSTAKCVPDQVADSLNTLWNCAVVAMVLRGNLQELTIWLDYQAWAQYRRRGWVCRTTSSTGQRRVHDYVPLPSCPQTSTLMPTHSIPLGRLRDQQRWMCKYIRTYVHTYKEVWYASRTRGYSTPEATELSVTKFTNKMSHNTR